MSGSFYRFGEPAYTLKDSFAIVDDERWKEGEECGEIANKKQFRRDRWRLGSADWGSYTFPDSMTAELSNTVKNESMFLGVVFVE